MKSARYTVRLVEGIINAFVVERDGNPPPIVSVWLPKFVPERERLIEERHQVAEAIARLLNGVLL